MHEMEQSTSDQQTEVADGLFNDYLKVQYLYSPCGANAEKLMKNSSWHIFLKLCADLSMTGEYRASWDISYMELICDNQIHLHTYDTNKTSQVLHWEPNTTLHESIIYVLLAKLKANIVK